MYIVETKDLDGTLNYYCAQNKHEAQIYQNTTLKFVKIYSPHEFLRSLRKLPKSLPDYLL